MYDVSRWGRFQNADESAYYEYICIRAGITVHYCAEPFENDGSPLSTIMKGVKRAMAGEYSRELSAKVFLGQPRLASMGSAWEAPAAMGFAACLSTTPARQRENYSPARQRTFRPIASSCSRVLGGSAKVVRWIYRRFVDDGRSIRRIQRELNREGHTW